MGLLCRKNEREIKGKLGTAQKLSKYSASIREDDVERGTEGRMAKGNQVRQIAKELIWSFETK